MSRTLSRPFSALFSAWTPRRLRRPSDQRRRRWLRATEGLEDRLLLSGNPTYYTVNLLSDTGASSGTDAATGNPSGDLLWAITQANANTNTAGSVIGFDPTVFSTPQTITLSSTLTLSETAGPEVISGPGANLLTVSGNHSVGVFLVNGGVNATIVGMTISHGAPNSNGGGIDNEGTLTVSNSAIADNSVGYNHVGGGIFNDSDGTLTVSNCTITNSSGYSGGGIDNAGTLTVSDSIFADNTSFSGGGGFINEATGAMTVSDCTIADNTGGGYGGGFKSDGTLTVSECTIADNSAWYGGGMTGQYGRMTIVDTTIAGNATVPGSGVYAGNPAGSGGGIFALSGTLTVSDCTIADNSAAVYGGGLWVSSGTATLDNTIVAQNNTDISGGVSSSSAYNLIGTGGSGGLVNGVNGNHVGVANPGLGPLADNGGPTQTIALLPGSPAIDAGSNSLAVLPTTGQPLVYDQRGPGFARIANGTVDIGAFEVQVTNAPVVTLEPANQTVPVGATASFTATASGNPAPTIQWQLSTDGGVTFGDISGATSDTYSFTAGAGQNGDQYVAVFTNSVGFTTSAAATLTVNTAPVVTTNPSNQTVAAGNTATFTVAASGQPAPTVQWQESSDGGTTFVNISGGTADTYSFTAAFGQNGDEYRAVFTNSVGSTTTSAALLTVVQPVTITSTAVQWGTQVSPPLVTQSDGLRLLPAGRSTDFPWLGIDQLQITLSQTEILAAGDVTVSSAVGVNYGPVTVSGSGTSYTITLAQPINEPDRVTITIESALIATYTRQLDVLPGDFNDDGVVNGSDLVGVHNEWLGINGAVPTIFGDINGDGVVSVTDYNDVRKQIGTVLPPVSDPAIAAAPASQSGPPVVQVAAVTPSVTDALTVVAPASQSGPAIVQIAATLPSASAAPIVVTPTSLGSPVIVQIGTSHPPQGAAASQARPRPRAEIQLSGRGSRLGTLTGGKMINQRLIERTY